MSFSVIGFKDMIHFFFENIEPRLLDSKLNEWLVNLITSEGKKPGEINYILCDDAYILSVNQQYLAHDYYTDIITFDYVKGNTVSGDIFVSLQRVADNAAALGKTFENELCRVLAHGLLHLCGYLDKTAEQEQQMRSKEDYYLNLF